jgi:hypothetical protein
MLQQLFYVWHPDSGEDGPGDGVLIRATDHQQAARKWARDYDRQDYPLSSVEDHRETVKVQMQANDARVHTYSVRCVIRQEYYADEVDPPPTPAPVPVVERLPGEADCASWPGEPDATPWRWAAVQAAQSLHKRTPYLIAGVSRSQFSIARHYGGTTYNGEAYTYIHETDELVRDDVLRLLAKRLREQRKAAKAAGQGSLLP